MLFFFELLLFVLVMLTLALGEFVSRGLALGVWLTALAAAVGGYLLARSALRPLLEGGRLGERGILTAPGPDGGDGAESASAEPPTGPADTENAAPTPLDERWARTLLYNWRRTNVLLSLGALAVGSWYWLGG